MEPGGIRAKKGSVQRGPGLPKVMPDSVRSNGSENTPLHIQQDYGYASPFIAAG
jgi:hypothetical protein